MDFEKVKTEMLAYEFASWDDAVEKLSTLAECEVKEVAPGLIIASTPRPQVYMLIMDVADKLMEKFGVVDIARKECWQRHDKCQTLMLGAAIEMIVHAGGDWERIKRNIAQATNVVAMKDKDVKMMFELLQTCKALLKEYNDNQQQRNNG